MSYREHYSYSFENTSLAAGAGTTFADTLVNLDSDADFEVMSRIHVATSDRIRCRFTDDSFGRYAQNVSTDLRLLSGRALPLWAQTGTIYMMSFFPHILSTPYMLSAGCVVTTSFADASGLENSIRETWHGAKIQGRADEKAPWDREWNQEVPFDYSTGLLSVTANGTRSYSLNIGMDAHFLVEQLVASRTGACLITIKDGSTDRQWMDRAAHIDNLFGSAIHPHVLLAKRFVTRGAPISIGITDLSGAANTVELGFVGTKCFGTIRGLDDIRPVQRG